MHRHDLSRSVGRRAREAAPRPPQPPATQKGPARAALARRERRVKDLLLRELAKMSDVGKLTYIEIQHLEKNLDVDFIDRELERLYGRLRWSRRLAGFLVPAAVLAGGVSRWRGRGLAGYHVQLFGSPLYAAGAFAARRAVQRKIFIHEALRLTDADLDLERRLPARLPVRPAARSTARTRRA